MWLSAVSPSVDEGLSFLSGAGLWESDRAPVSVWATQIGYVFLFLFFGGESHKSREGGLGRTGEGVTGVHDVHDVGEHVGVGEG